jgi:hypothetical protein
MNRAAENTELAAELAAGLRAGLRADYDQITAR